MSADDGLGPRPPQDERIQAYVKNQATWSAIATISGLGYAGDDPNPRPMTQVDLGRFADVLNRSVAPLRQEIPDAAVFAIWSTRRRVPLRRGMAVPPEHRWWFARAEDTALLSDRQTHHFCSVSHVDRDAGLISFSDPWADRFFLKAGRNTLGISAEGTRISRADFARAAVGLTCWDRVGLFDAYLQAFPGQAESAELCCRIGHAVLNVGSDRLLPVAVKHFDRARALARASADRALELHAAARMYLAATAGFAVWKSAGVESMAETLAALSADARQYDTAQVLIEQLEPAELCRLAFCVSLVGRHDMAEAAATRALERDPAFEDGWWQRGTARFKQGRAADALADADHYLALSDRTLPVARTRHTALHPMDSVGASMLGAEVGEREQRRTAVLELAVSAAAHLNDAPRALGYLRLVHALHPGREDVVQRLSLLGA
jgi:tetratricopeptide (TPR) repeat protein